MNNSPPLPSWKRCCEVKIDKREKVLVSKGGHSAWGGKGIIIELIITVSGNNRTADQHKDSALLSVSISEGDEGTLSGEAQPVETAVISPGKLSVYSNRKAEWNADCQGETFLGCTQAALLFLTDRPGFGASFSLKNYF